jgi:hypothetical protein
MRWNKVLQIFFLLKVSILSSCREDVGTKSGDSSADKKLPKVISIDKFLDSEDIEDEYIFMVEGFVYSSIGDGNSLFFGADPPESFNEMTSLGFYLSSPPALSLPIWGSLVEKESKVNYGLRCIVKGERISHDGEIVSISVESMTIFNDSDLTPIRGKKGN